VLMADLDREKRGTSGRCGAVRAVAGHHYYQDSLLQGLAHAVKSW
jgi:hypothetical protein